MSGNTWCGYDLVGSFKLQVSFAEYSLFYRALLQKRPIFFLTYLVAAQARGDSDALLRNSHISPLSLEDRERMWRQERELAGTLTHIYIYTH